jgi:5-methyltetrahydropteroyltriglutamate--homocysteine methyltransferase
MAIDEEAVRRDLPGIIKDIASKQVDLGIDIVNDGEYGKFGGSGHYLSDRLSGWDVPPPEQELPPHSITIRDEQEFPGFYEANPRGLAWGRAARPTGDKPIRSDAPIFCTGPLSFVGQGQVAFDIANIQSAVADKPAVQPFIAVAAVGLIEHWLKNRYYKDDEAFLFGLADAMHDCYKAITDAGILLQIDDPDVSDAWGMYPGMSIEEYRKYAQLRGEALNHALRDCPQDLIRLHVCWGSGHGPHKNDIDLRHIVDLIFMRKAGSYSIEAANPRHSHEWEVFETFKLPEGVTLMPGVIGHTSDLIEHPELVSQRLVQFANLVGRENVIAGTDCGMGNRLSHPELAWAKLESLVEGSRIASKKLWN